MHTVQTDTAPPTTPIEILTSLLAHGFSPESSSPSHVTLRRGAQRIVVPVFEPTVPRTVVQALEWTVDRTLDPGWLRGGRDPFDDRVPLAEPIELDAVVREDDETVVALLVAEPNVFTYGRDRVEALDHLADAVALWLGVDPGRIRLRL